MNLTQTEEARLLTSTTLGVRMALTTTAPTDTTAGTEVTGGLYARPSITFSTPTSGQITNTASVLFLELPACRVVAWELWSSDGYNRRWFGFFSTASFAWNSDVVTANAHGRVDGSPIVFVGTVPAGITVGTVYFVRDSTTNTFKVAATSGGAALTLAGSGSGSFARVIDVPAGETLQVDAGQLNLSLS